MAGDLVYFVVPVQDAEKGKAFFGELFGWSFETGNVPGGFHIHGSNPPGGMFAGGGGQPSVYFSVDDIHAAVTRIRELGGEAGEPTEAGDFGRYAYGCRDDQGVRFGLHEPPR